MRFFAGSGSGGGAGGRGASILAELREAEWLSRRRVLLDAGVLMVLEIGATIFFIALTHGWVVPLVHPTTTDFASFYAAGSLADAGTPHFAYDPVRHHAAEELATEPGVGYIFFYYPPIFLMVCAVLARMPYLVAFIAFELATLAAFLLVGRAILRERGWGVLVPLVAFPAVFWTFGVGQNGFLTAALFGAGTMLLDRRPVAGGLLLGALSFKPQFGLLIPIALAAGRQWRAFLAAAAAVAALSLLSLMWFGLDTWRGFFASLAGSHLTYESGRIDLGAMINPFGAVRLVGGSAALAYGVHAIVALVAAAAVAVVWRRAPADLPARAATLIAATLLAAPVALMYDMTLALIAGAWLVRRGAERGFLPWEKSLLTVIYLVPLVSRLIGDIWRVPIAPFALAALVALGVIHAVSDGTEARAG